MQEYPDIAIDPIIEHKVRSDWNFPKIEGGSVMPLVFDGDPRLLQVSEDYVFEDAAKSNQLILDMSATMRYNKGIGLAAIQVGLPIRLFLMEIGDTLPLALFNPKIVDEGEPIELVEGCLSFPELILKVKRASHVRARFTNLNGEVITYNFEGLSARIFLHEFSHLEGRTMKDEVSKLRWEMAMKKRGRK